MSHTLMRRVFVITGRTIRARRYFCGYAEPPTGQRIFRRNII